MSTTLLTISFNELVQVENIERDTIVDIVTYGVVEPVEGSDTETWVFDVSSVRWVKKAVRLNQDLDIDWVAVAMVIDLLQQRDDLQRNNQIMAQQLKRFLDT